MPPSKRAWGRPHGRSGPVALVVVLGLVAALPGACAPNRIPAGPGPTEPRLEPERLIAHDGTALPLRRWLPASPDDASAPKAVILALHGFNDYSKAFEAPGGWLAERGYAVYAYDQRGFGAGEHRGLWAGSEALTADLASASALLRARHPGVPLFLLGESMGAAVVIVAMTRPGAPRVDGVILSAPAVWARSAMPIHQRVALWLAARLMPGARFSGSGLRIQASDNIEMLRALGRDPLVIKGTRVDAMDGLTDLMSEALAAAPRLEAPALILYGERDEVVPEDSTLAFLRGLPPRGSQRPALYPEGWHMLLRDLKAEVVLADIAGWIDEPAAALASGADRQAREALTEKSLADSAAPADRARRTSGPARGPFARPNGL